MLDSPLANDLGFSLVTFPHMSQAIQVAIAESQEVEQDYTHHSLEGTG